MLKTIGKKLFMRGVSKVTGPANPKIGETNYYEVAEFYSGTTIENYNNIKWKLYQFKDGKWELLQGPVKTGKKVPYTFPQKWLGKQLLIEAYLYEPEAKPKPGHVVKPVLGVAAIKKTEILNATGGAIQQKPLYGQYITLKVTTENMLGQTLKLSLWDRDTISDTGHDAASNQLLWSGSARVSSNNGVVEQRILLSPTLMALAGKSMMEGEEHEYYLLVEGKTLRTKSQTAIITTKKETPTTVKPVIKQVPVQVKDKIGTDPIQVKGTNTAVVQNVPATQQQHCGEQYCIKKGDKSALIQEINIRLAGFGGNIPTDMFTDRTEKMIRQFQRDYMKVPETGKICGNVLKAIDDFQHKFIININDARCPCGGCSGFGNGKFSEQKGNTSINEMHRKYEYPGMHRTIMWVQRAILFYLSDKKKGLGLRFGQVSSGYRCNINNAQKKRKSTNHMGKAIDLHFYKANDRVSSEANCDKVRDLLMELTGAKLRWNEKNVIALEPSTRNKIGGEFLATTWVHYDVRTFEVQYLADKFFAKNMADVNGISIVALANELGHQKTCICSKDKQAEVKPVAATNTNCFCNRDISAAELVLLGISQKNADKYVAALNTTFKNYNINTCERKLHFIAQVRHESGEFVYQEEIASGAAYEGRADLGNTQTGDGVRFKGRGLIQITGRSNYKAYSTYKGFDFTKEPNNKKMGVIPYCVDSAGWFFETKTSLNAHADKDDLIYISYRINGGFNGFDDRKKKLTAMIKAITCNKTTFENFEAYSIKKSKAWDTTDALYKYGALKNSESKDAYKRYLALTDDYLTWPDVKNSSSLRNKITKRRAVALAGSK
jgi:predicted chitinase